MPRSLTYTGMMYLTLSTLLLTAIFGAAGTRHRDAAQESAGPSFTGATGWLNSEPLSLARLRGKVILIDFWTYTCINWRRTLPYIREWASKYKDQGLVVIGVHTPEFSFEHSPKNVGKAIQDMNIGYPVATDNNFDIWRSFQNQYWPALYLIDGSGKLRYQKFGEGDYEKIEFQIQKLLKEASSGNLSGPLVALQPQGFEVAADWDNLQSPENYLSYGRTEGFVSPEKVHVGKQVSFSIPGELKLNQWALAGVWTVGSENARLSKGQGKIIYRFHARDLHLIMGSAAPGTSVKFRVLLYGRPPGSAHGLDVDSNGYGTVTEHRMYQLIRQQGAITDREFEIEFLEPGVEVYDFTFG
jgi:thiol-disulfide isomerase/thioredoxin